MWVPLHSDWYSVQVIKGRPTVAPHISRKTSAIWGTRVRGRAKFLTPLRDSGWMSHTYTML